MSEANQADSGLTDGSAFEDHEPDSPAEPTAAELAAIEAELTPHERGLVHAYLSRVLRESYAEAEAAPPPTAWLRMTEAERYATVPQRQVRLERLSAPRSLSLVPSRPASELALSADDRRVGDGDEREAVA